MKTRLSFDTVGLLTLVGTLILGVAASGVIQAVVTTIALLLPSRGILNGRP